MKIISCLTLLCMFVLLACDNNPETTSKNSENKTPEKPIELEKISLKKSTLTKLIGEHRLLNISGFMGANTMVDYYLEKGHWIASGSSISDGMREPFDIDLSFQNQKKLNSMKIAVGKDLSVKLLCDGRTYFMAPYNENGMAYLLNKSPIDYEFSMSKDLKQNSTFIENDLYLYANDQVSESDLSQVDLAEVGADVVSIKYSTEKKAFEMTLFFGACCDVSIYTFK